MRAQSENRRNVLDRKAGRTPRVMSVPDTCLTVLAAACVLISLVASPVLHADVIDRILAVVGGEMITLSDVNSALRFGLVPPPADRDPIRSALDALINRQLELVEVNRYQPPEPAAQAIEERLTAIHKRFPTAPDFDKALAQSGLTPDELRARLRDDERISTYLDQRFGVGLQVSDEDLVAYYRSHETAFTRAGVLRPYSEVREQVRAMVLNEKRQELIKDWLAGLRRRAEITDLYLRATEPSRSVRGPSEPITAARTTT
jgi:hypothetical protein